ncbi:hypothetical protein N7495_008960 [Penicillium taxi]|uniref:uncharacterized protein n=1 Tax=Penicillium taxi TaxID=168475 RepID=UPI0025452503|nr:uncharacterized protein N7495_008960 [Penicillium taxi]KAJ5888919.1 hypothetical protein N7495_008960 [Penicillium taxi]
MNYFIIALLAATAIAVPPPSLGVDLSAENTDDASIIRRADDSLIGDYLAAATDLAGLDDSSLDDYLATVTDLANLVKRDDDSLVGDYLSAATDLTNIIKRNEDVTVGGGLIRD